MARLRNFVFFLSVLSLAPMTICSQDLSTLYPDSTLRYWQARYAPNIMYNLEEVVLPELTADESSVLGPVRVDFPLVGSYGDPLNFYSDVLGRVIFMPILSIKFVDDLSVAEAWLEAKGVGYGRIADYIAMLKYKKPSEFPGGRYLPPLQAMNIPNDALNDAAVNDTSQKILKSAIVWIMAHELGHLYHRHPSYNAVSAAVARDNETEADNFATEMMRRIGVVPVGAGIYMLAAVNWCGNRGDFSTEGEYEDYLRRANHPITSERLNNLAQLIELSADDFARKEPNRSSALVATHKVAEQFRELSKILSDSSFQAFFRARVEAMDPAALGKYP
ncbi:MAG: hypothetical protein ABSG38_12190 [Spirochaetia bacterium]|jgi:hypothetical protein